MESRDIAVALKLDVSAKEVWNLWTDSKSLERWLTNKAIVEPRVGGAYELFWDPPTPNDNSTLGCKIIGLEKEKYLAFQWRGPVPFADLMNVEPFPTWVVVTFEILSPTQTLIHFRHSGWGKSARWDAARKWQANAWNGAFKELSSITLK